jgi:hypothetical protein
LPHSPSADGAGTPSRRSTARAGVPEGARGASGRPGASATCSTGASSSRASATRLLTPESGHSGFAAIRLPETRSAPGVRLTQMQVGRKETLRTPPRSSQRSSRAPELRRRNAARARDAARAIHARRSVREPPALQDRGAGTIEDTLDGAQTIVASPSVEYGASEAAFPEEPAAEPTRGGQAPTRPSGQLARISTGATDRGLPELGCPTEDR